MLAREPLKLRPDILSARFLLIGEKDTELCADRTRPKDQVLNTTPQLIWDQPHGVCSSR